MEKLFLFLFIPLIATIPLLYRFIKLGKSSWYVKKDELDWSLNYNKVEKIRLGQTILGYMYFFFHGSFFWGWYNMLIFTGTAFLVSLFLEIIGPKIGIFGGVYKYHDFGIMGIKFMGVPLLIPLIWAGLIYMSLNLCSLITNYNLLNKTTLNTFFLISVTSFVLVLLDMILDPIAVDEKRWEWEIPGAFYKVPLMNFVGWFFTSFIILWIFHFMQTPKSVMTQSKFFVIYSPGILMGILPGIAARPCFERNLKIPGFIGIALTIIFGLMIINKYQIIG